MRIKEVIISPNLKLITGLKKIYGISYKRIIHLCNFVGVKPKIRIKNLDKDKLVLIEKLITNNYIIGSELKHLIIKDIKYSLDIKSFKGLRLKNGYPANGQSARSNGRTSRKKLYNNIKI